MKLYFCVIFLTNLSPILICTSCIPQNFFTKSKVDDKKDITPNIEYATALKYSLLFIEAQRSGKLPNSNRIPWRGDSALFDRGFEGEDLTGGYYDGTTFVKFIWPMAFTSTILSWGVITWKESFIHTNQLYEVYDAIRWATDYFMKCHVKPNVLYFQVGDLNVEKEYWGRPEDMNGRNRTAYQINETKPASDVAAEVAAAFAAASIVFKDVNSDYSAKCLRHAKELYKFAIDYPAALVDNFYGPWEFYGNDREEEYIDELIWAALWIYNASNEITYLNEAMNLYSTNFTTANLSLDFYFDKKAMAIELLLSEALGNYSHLYDIASNNMIFNADLNPAGLEYLNDEDTLPYAANKAFLYLQLSKNLDPISRTCIAYNTLAREQIRYMLGSQSQGKNFVVGFNENSPKYVYNRASSCPDRPKNCGWENFHHKEPNPQILYGALVSGPDWSGRFDDKRHNYEQNKVALFFNAGFTGALAGLMYENIRIYTRYTFFETPILR